MEVMVAVGIVGFVIAGATTYFLNSKRYVKEMKAAQTMRSIARTLNRIAQNPQAIAFSSSIGVNNKLEACVWTDPKFKNDSIPSRTPVRCDSTDPQRQVPMSLYIAPKDRSKFNARRLRVAGTDKDPVWYSIDGKRACNPKKPDCIFAAKSYFWATCPSDSSDVRNLDRAKASLLFSKSCYRAQSVSVRFQLTHVHNKRRLKTKFRPLKRQLASIPKNSVFWRGGKAGGKHTTANASSTNVASLGLYADYIEACPVNYTLLKVVDSKPICRCLAPYKEVMNGVCALIDHTCPEGERYLGLNLRGQPLCKKVTCQDQVISLSDATSFDFDCFPHGWVNKIEPLGSAKNCECEEIAAGPNIELGTWDYSCRLNCAFRVTCCRE